MKRKMLLSIGAGLAALGLALFPAAAQEPPEGYPERPIELVVVYPAGGGMDVTARTLAQEAERILGHSFRVQNRTGGAGLVGHTWLAKNAPADGYAVGVIGNPNLHLDFLSREGDFDETSFTPIVGINFTPLLWTVQADGPLADLDFQEIIEKAKAEPGEVSIAIVPNSSAEFVVDIVEGATGAEFNHVPFQGGKPGVVALLGGNVDIAATFYDESEPQIRAGEIKVVTLSDTERFEALPDVPTMAELGIPIEGGVWGASRLVVVPPQTPEPIQRYLEEAFLKVMNDPAAIESFKKAGISLTPTDAEQTQQKFNESVTVLENFLKETGRSQ